MTDRRIPPGGNAQRRDVVGQDLLQGESAVATRGAAVGALAEHEPGQLIQNACQLELGQHAIDAVDRLAHVF